jgi:hypothetical protein
LFCELDRVFCDPTPGARGSLAIPLRLWILSPIREKGV